MSIEDARQKARVIVRSAMENRGVYDDMARRENQVWGQLLPKRANSAASAEDIAAARDLRIARHHGTLLKLMRDRGMTFRKGLTLGCGAGRLERSLLEAKICTSFHGIDISDNAIAEARAEASRQNLPVTYEVGDMNSMELPQHEFDLVVAQTSLHHVLFLEHVANQVWRTLRPDGYLWIHDYIGETQGQYDGKRLEIANRVLAVLPEKYRKNRISGRTLTQASRPEPGRLASPFEMIRSEDIVPVFQRWFDTEWENTSGTIIHLIAPPGTRVPYAESEDSRAILELLLLVDEICREEKVLKPAAGQFLMRPKPVPVAAEPAP
jgi:2-polyprenyl-3-methyl-5-hydroxy-6-metoxy-1,4-benzoquinol methylase